jgi:hypothetical protein
VSGLLIIAGPGFPATATLPGSAVTTTFGVDTRVSLAQQPSVFPVDRPVPDGDAVHLLRGSAWGPGGVPPDAARAEGLVRAMGRQLIEDGHLFPDGHRWSGLFTLVSVTADAVLVASDPSGLYPLYLWARPGRVAVSSHERVLARAVAAPADLRGVVQTAAFGYAIGDRTLHQGIRQLPAGSSVRIDRRSGQVTRRDHPALYGPVDPAPSVDELADELWSLYTRGVEQMTTRPGRAGMLMSGGFDTRLVSLGFSRVARPVVGLTIGDPDNHEVAMAERLARLSGATWTRRTAQPDLDGLESAAAAMLEQAESLCFPTCWFGGRELADLGATTLSTGYGGETLLGGQGYGQYLGTPSRQERLLAVGRRSVGRAPDRRGPLDAAAVRQTIDAITASHRASLLVLANRVPPDLLAVVHAEQGLIEAEVEAEVHRYLAVGPTAVEQLAERFLLEHHVRKHFGRQELTLDAVRPLLLPTLDTALVLACSTAEPHLKVDHRTYLRMVRRHFGAYARIPTSNVPVRLDRPEPVLWAARSARAVWDDRQTALQQRTHGAKGRRHGWSNYEVWARRSTVFDQLPRLIAPWLIDPGWLQRKLAKQSSWQERFFSGQEHLVFATVSGLVEPPT